MFSWSCRFARCCSLELVAYLPLQRCQISSTNKQQVEVENCKQWYNVHCLEKCKPINTLVDAVLTANFVRC